MKNDSAIVFTATFLGVITSVFTFNHLVENDLLPSKAPTIAKIDVEPQVARAAETTEEIPTVAARNASLKNIVDDALEGSKGTYGVAIKNLKTGETFYMNERQAFESASIYKLWVMGGTFEQLKEGKLKEDDVLSADVQDLNKQFGIASESAERTEGGISLSVKSALQQMITISHNYAALLLTSKIKLAHVTAFLQKNQLTESRVGQPPKTTAADTLKFFEKLYKGQLADADSTTKMLTLLKKQQLNHKLPRFLPGGTVVAHKTGELGGVSHDGGIVYTNKGDYIIVIMSQSTAPKGAEDRIAEISKGVYAYFTK